MATRRGRPRIGKTGCLFWLFIFLVIIVIILYRGKGSFRQTFSLFRDRVDTREEVQKQPTPTSTSSEDVQEKDLTEETRPSKEAAETEPSRSTQEDKSPAPKAEKLETPTGKTEVSKKNLKAPLYYVVIDTDGSARLQPVVRTVRFVDSPITRTIESLLGGPTSSERERGLISFIPEGTTLISAHLKSGHLTLNFSEDFEENYNGREAIHFQLSQVMLTSFEFKQVSALTILIGGRQKRYITGEGIPLKEVYTKDDLSLPDTPG
jgi:spore germination protein GerM